MDGVGSIQVASLRLEISMNCLMSFISEGMMGGSICRRKRPRGGNVGGSDGNKSHCANGRLDFPLKLR